jgi:hypothetical protein
LSSPAPCCVAATSLKVLNLARCPVAPNPYTPICEGNPFNFAYSLLFGTHLLLTQLGYFLKQTFALPNPTFPPTQKKKGQTYLSPAKKKKKKKKIKSASEPTHYLNHSVVQFPYIQQGLYNV